MSEDYLEKSPPRPENCPHRRQAWIADGLVLGVPVGIYQCQDCLLVYRGERRGGEEHG